MDEQETDSGFEQDVNVVIQYSRVSHIRNHFLSTV